ncbi:aspartate dehydrogenase [Candidatus Micrarchaeota archaeon]|nr:aspartate dehydrogenase [Candidatus Micrarchaeota archaeon]
MKIGIIGIGAIGSFLVENLPAHEFVVFDVDTDKSQAAVATLSKMGLSNVRFVSSFVDLLSEKPELVVEAAAQAAVPLLLDALNQSDALVMSVGALTDDALLAKLNSTAQKSGHKLLIPSGAVGGLDVLQACRPSEVVLETRKSPKSLNRSDSEETVVFDGSARAACQTFPKNVNVAATLSLAGIGFDKTRVRIVSDPKIMQNTHTVRIKGAAGHYVFTFQNEPFLQNPATSQLAAYSALWAISKQNAAIQIG